MEGFKLIKTTFESNKEIVGVNFHGDDSYYLFLEEVRKTYNLPDDYEIQVYSKEFIIRPNIFTQFVAQYISNLNFILDIKGKNPLKRSQTSVTPSDSQTKLERCLTPTTSCDSQQLPLNIVTVERCLTPTTLYDSHQQQISSETDSLQQGSPTTTPTSFDLQHILSTASINLQTIPSNCEIVQIPDIQEVLQLRVLENKHRTKIAKAIISKIFTDNPDVRLLREEFMQLAQSIVEIFPSEVKETYYVPFTKGHLARGKLYDAYNNTRARLSASGVRRRRIRFKASPTVDNSNILTDSEVEEQQLEILKTGNAEWNSILEAWEKTHAFRQNEFKAENMEALDYMEKYKVLQHKNNYQLFEIDYKLLYPQSKNIYEWRLYYHKVMDKAEKLKDNCVKEILNNITNTGEEDSKLALSLLLVPYLLPTSRQRSRLEVQESFISYSKNLDKLVKEEDTDTDDEQQQHDNAKRLKLDNIPKITIIGDSTKPICFAYLDMYGRRHRFQNPLQAIEVCFQCFVAMNIKYPKFCEHIWIFIQKLIFRISTANDIAVPSIDTLINDLQQ